jgi:lipid-A-disaccharide synthase-like uncharacterized protein
MAIFYKLSHGEIQKALEVEEYYRLIGIVLLCIFVLGGLIGLLAAKTENRCCIFLDQIYLSILVALFLALYIITLMINGIILSPSL